MNDTFGMLAWTQIWQVTLVACGAGLLAALFCRRRPHLAYVLWLVVLVKCVTPPIWSSPTGVFSWAARGSTATETVADAASVGATANLPFRGDGLKQEEREGTERSQIVASSKSRTGHVPSPKKQATDFADFHRLEEEKEKHLRQSAKSADENAGRSANLDSLRPAEIRGTKEAPARLNAGASLRSSPGHPARFGLTSIFCLIWLAGAAVYAAGALWMTIGGRRAVRRSSAPADERLASLAGELARRLGIRRRVRLLVSREPLGPVTFGSFRPTIVLPQLLLYARSTKPVADAASVGAASLSQSPSAGSLDELEPLLAHELVHVRRRDSLVGLLQVAAQAVWWFHPLVWWANRQLSRERERCCDEEVVAGLAYPPARYARGLLDVLELKHQLRSLAALPGVRPFDITKRRLEHVMRHANRFHKRTPRPYWLILLAGIFLLAPAAGLSRTGEQAEPGANAPKPPVTNAAAANDRDQKTVAETKRKLEPVLQSGHFGPVTCVAYSSDGRYVLTGSNDSTAIVWDAATGRQLRVFRAQTGSVTAVAFSPDATKVIIASDDGLVALSDLTTGQPVHKFTRQDQPAGARAPAAAFVAASSLATSPDGKQLLVGYLDQTASLWDMATGEEIRTLQGHGPIRAVAFAPDGKYVATTGWGDDAAVLWDVATGENVHAYRGDKIDASKANAGANSLAFNGRELLAGMPDHMVISWDLEGHRLRTFQGNRSPVVAAIFNDDGSQVLTRNQEGAVILWDSASRRKVHTLQPAIHQGTQYPNSLAFSPRGESILGGADDGVAAIWNSASGKKIRTFQQSRDVDRILWAAIGPDAKQLFIKLGDGTLVSWDTSLGKRVQTFKDGTDENALQEFFLPALSLDGKRLLTGGASVVLWDTASGEKIRTFDGQFSNVPVPATARAGRAGGPARAVAPRGRGFDPSGPVRGLGPATVQVESVVNISVAISPDGKRVAAWGSDEIIVWEADTGTVIGSYSEGSGARAFREAITGVAFYPDGKQLLASLYGSGPLQKVVGEEVVGKMPLTLWAGFPVASLSFTSDGSKAFGDLDVDNARVAFLAKFPSGDIVHMFGGTADREGGDYIAYRRFRTQDSPPPVAFSPDGTQVLTAGSYDNPARLWDMASGKAIRRLQGDNGCARFALFTPDGKRLLAGGKEITAVLWDLTTGREQAQLITWHGGKDWLVFTPEGLFDGSEGGRDKLAFRVDGGLKVAPAKEFEKEFYRPGLLAVLLRGEAPPPAGERGK